MEKIFVDENEYCKIDFSSALWTTGKIHTIFQDAGLHLFNDVDFVAETDDALLFVEYKNVNIPQAINPNAFNPKDDKTLNNVARKYFFSQYFIHMINRGRHKKQKYIYILECIKGDKTLRKLVRDRLIMRLPFLLQKQNNMKERMIDSLEVLSMDEWNETYPQFLLTYEN